MTLKTVEEIQEELETAKQRLEELENCDNEDEYDEALDEQGTVSVGGLEFYPSKILSECDPVAYRCGHTDFNDSLITEQNELIESLEDELKDAIEEETEEKKGV
jgi:hypothetical protein